MAQEKLKPAINFPAPLSIIIQQKKEKKNMPNPL